LNHRDLRNDFSFPLRLCPSKVFPQLFVWIPDDTTPLKNINPYQRSDHFDDEKELEDLCVSA
jgi:hypothetical protein